MQLAGPPGEPGKDGAPGDGPGPPGPPGADAELHDRVLPVPPQCPCQAPPGPPGPPGAEDQSKTKMNTQLIKVLPATMDFQADRERVRNLFTFRDLR